MKKGFKKLFRWLFKWFFTIIVGVFTWGLALIGVVYKLIEYGIKTGYYVVHFEIGDHAAVLNKEEKESLK